VVGARPRKQAHSNALDHSRIRQLLDAADMPPVPRHDSNVLIAGVGGTGVITIGAVLAMAAHLEGARASVLDMTGLAQKGGSVISHVRITTTGSPTAPVRIDAGQTDTALVCDMIAATRPEALSTFSTPRTSLVINTHTAPTAHFIQDPDAATGGDQALALLRSCVAQERAQTLDAHALAVQHLGDSVFSNMIMLGYAWQKGRVPVSEAALLRAIELNGVAVEKNQMALRLGRLACLNPAAAAGHEPARLQAPEPLERLLQRLHDELVAYHNAAYARQFSQRISQVHQAEKRIFPANAGRLTRSAALALHKLMAVKDEYEVARLLCSPHFHQQLREQFEGDIQLRYHLSPPLLAPRDKHTGLPRKITLGSWAQTAFQGLRRLKVLRFTPLDIFGFTAERRLERRLARDFQRTLGKVAAGLTRENYAQALELVSLPMQLRGFGHVKAAHIPAYQARLAELGALFGAPAPEPTGHRQAAL
jgi:indolepyruvate ferredoxin oxidoreductase